VRYKSLKVETGPIFKFANIMQDELEYCDKGISRSTLIIMYYLLILMCLMVLYYIGGVIY